MFTLHIQNIPVHVYQSLKTKAEENGRSLNQQVTITLEKGLSFCERSHIERKQIIERITTDQDNWEGWDTLDVAEIIRNDRDR